MLTMLAAMVAYIGDLVIDKPSVNCLNAWNIIRGINENATKSKYGIASFTTSSGCFIKYINGLANSISKNNNKLKTIHKNKPCLKDDFPFKKLFSESASAINGVIAVENPIPRDIAIKIKLFPKETAANSAVPIWPTIILSTKLTKVCPNIPNITGAANFQLYLNSEVYLEIFKMIVLFFDCEDTY